MSYLLWNFQKVLQSSHHFGRTRCVIQLPLIQFSDAPSISLMCAHEGPSQDESVTIVKIKLFVFHLCAEHACTRQPSDNPHLFILFSHLISIQLNAETCAKLAMCFICVLLHFRQTVWRMSLLFCFGYPFPLFVFTCTVKRGPDIKSMFLRGLVFIVEHIFVFWRVHFCSRSGFEHLECYSL